MKVTSKPKVTTNDGTPFPIRFELNGLSYLKLCGNSKRALYSVMDAKHDKLKGFMLHEPKKMIPIKSLKEINFKTLQ
jgi:hypothetical protein